MAITSPRASEPRAFPNAPLDRAENLREWIRLVAQVVNGLMNGKDNATGKLTLTANAATTTLSDRRIGRETVVLLTPTTANASAEFGAGTIYQTHPNANVEAAVINHANDANADKTFAYSLRG